MPESVITDAMRAMLDREVDEGIAEVTTTSCRFFARAVGHTDPIFYDEAAARARGFRSIVAPPGHLGTPIGGPTTREQIAVPAPIARLHYPYRRVLDGGTEYEYFETVTAGDVLASRSKITRFDERVGSIGPMIIDRKSTRLNSSH